MQQLKKGLETSTGPKEQNNDTKIIDDTDEKIIVNGQNQNLVTNTDEDATETEPTEEEQDQDANDERDAMNDDSLNVKKKDDEIN